MEFISIYINVMKDKFRNMFNSQYFTLIQLPNFLSELMLFIIIALLNYFLLLKKKTSQATKLNYHLHVLKLFFSHSIKQIHYCPFHNY